MKQHDTVSRKVCNVSAICLTGTAEKTYTRRSHLHFFDRQLSHAIGLSALAVSTVQHASQLSTYHSRCVIQELCTRNLWRWCLSVLEYPATRGRSLLSNSGPHATRLLRPYFPSPFRSLFIKPAHSSMILRRGRETVDAKSARWEDAGERMCDAFWRVRGGLSLSARSPQRLSSRSTMRGNI
jgi:hypothetical protein